MVHFKLRAQDGYTYEFMDCNACGVVFGSPEYLIDNRRQSKASFYCPNGHSMSYTENEADKLRRERNRLQQQIAQKDDEIRDARVERDKAEREAKRLKKRAAAGACPVCNRTFENMARHMRHMHSDFVCEGSGEKRVVALLAPPKRA